MRLRVRKYQQITIFRLEVDHSFEDQVIDNVKLKAVKANRLPVELIMVW